MGLRIVFVVRLLVIGGTSFVGRHAVELAVAEGDEVAVFHRGRTNPDLLEGRVRHLVGDRDTGDYRSLSGTDTLSSGASGCWNGNASSRLNSPCPMLTESSRSLSCSPGPMEG